MASLRAGLIGLGVMGRHHARMLSTLEGVDFVGVVDSAAIESPLVDVMPDVDALLARKPDYCVVAVPTALHEAVGLRLADAGVHALIEKPLAADLAGAQRLADAFNTSGLVGAVGHIERFNPALQEARRRLEAGELGKVFQIATRRQGPFPARISDVGVVKDLATHDIDLTSWISQSQYATVSAHAAFRTGRQHEDLISVVGELADGTIASHLVNWLSPFKERSTMITGERGTFQVDTLTADLTFYANGSVESIWPEVAQFRGVSEGNVIRYAISKPEPLRTEHETFRDAVLGHDVDVVTMDQGLRTVEVAESILRSAALGQSIRLQGS